MASSREGFRKFGMWKKSRTVLNLTIFTNAGVRDKWQGAIFFVDESDGIVGFADDATHAMLSLDLSAAAFEVEVLRVEATRPPNDRLVFTEALISLRATASYL